MNDMNMPGFTAEASLYRPSAGYLVVSGVDQAGNVVTPQVPFPGCDLGCLTDCFFDCQDFPPRFRAACARRCRLECCRH